MTPAQLLAALPLGHRDWKRILACILAIHGREHGTKDKVVSNQTMYERPRFLFQFFEELHTQTIYHTVEPRCLGNRHVAAMVAVWAERGLSAGTIANYLSMLCVFAAWIGKDPKIVRTAAQYLGSDSVLAHRHQVADEDHSWIAAGVVHADVLEQIRSICPYVAIQTEFSKLVRAASEGGTVPSPARGGHPMRASPAERRGSEFAGDALPAPASGHQRWPTPRCPYRDRRAMGPCASGAGLRSSGPTSRAPRAHVEAEQGALLPGPREGRHHGAGERGHAVRPAPRIRQRRVRRESRCRFTGPRRLGAGSRYRSRGAAYGVATARSPPGPGHRFVRWFAASVAAGESREHEGSRMRR